MNILHYDVQHYINELPVGKCEHELLTSTFSSHVSKFITLYRLSHVPLLPSFDLSFLTLALLTFSRTLLAFTSVKHRPRV